MLVSYKLLRQSGVVLRGLKDLEKTPGKMYTVYWYRSNIHIFLPYFLTFTSFNTMPLILLEK